MRGRLWPLLGLLVALGGIVPVGPADAKEKKPMIPGAKAEAGAPLRTTLLPSPSSPLVAFRLQLRCGAINDPAGKEGLNALTALTIAQGGTRELTYNQVTERLFPMAATIDAQADKEVTTFIGNVHRDHLKAYTDLLAGVLLQPRFEESDFKRSRDILLAAIETNLRANDDEGLGKAALGWMMYEGHPYRNLDIGSVQGLKSITLDDVKAYYRKFYTQGNVVLGVAGGYPAGLVDSLQKEFTALPAGAPAEVKLPRPRHLSGMEVTFVEKAASATAISIGFPIDVTRADKDFCALLVANSYLGEHRTFNGRLMNKMRGERGLNYGDYSYIENFIQDGGSTFPLPNLTRRQQFFSIWIRPVPDANALFALRQATRELKMLVERGLSAGEFNAARTFVVNYSKLWAQDQSRRLGYAMDSEFYGTKGLLQRIQDELPHLKLEDVNKAVKRHLQASDLAVAIVTGNAEAMKETLLSGKPTPITYQTPTTGDNLLKEDKEIESFALPLNRDRVRVVKARELFEK
jgi:zinc protease